VVHEVFFIKKLRAWLYFNKFYGGITDILHHVMHQPSKLTKDFNPRGKLKGASRIDPTLQLFEVLGDIANRVVVQGR
jgi:hypothetical protein